eukprot:14610547-Ditylum_brightwellii.AAC.1
MEIVYKLPIDTDEEESELDWEGNKLSKNNRSSAWIQKQSKSTAVPMTTSKETKENMEKSTAEMRKG